MTAWSCFYAFISYKNFHTSTMGGVIQNFGFCFVSSPRKETGADGRKRRKRACFPVSLHGSGALLYNKRARDRRMRAWRNGRRAGFRIRYLCVWGFESLRSHQKSFGNSSGAFSFVRFTISVAQNILHYPPCLESHQAFSIQCKRACKKTKKTLLTTFFK